jgi:hypothetical protein
MAFSLQKISGVTFHDRPRGRHDRALAATRTTGVGGAEAQPARAAAAGAGLLGAGRGGGDCRGGGSE